METGITAITEKLYIHKFADNVFNSTALLNKLKAGEKEYDGGSSIVVPIEYAELVSGGSFQGLGLLDTAVNDLATQAQYEWREYYVEKVASCNGNITCKPCYIGETLSETIPTEVVSDPLETTRRATQWVGDIVRSMQRCIESSRNVYSFA